MNSGFQDVSELVHAVREVGRNSGLEAGTVYGGYCEGRRRVNGGYLGKAMENYEITRRISVALGYSPDVLDYFRKGTVMGAVMGMLPRAPPAVL